MWLEFPPREHVDYKDQTQEYFTKVNIVDIFGLGCENLKTTIMRLHPNTKRELVKLYIMCMEQLLSLIMSFVCGLLRATLQSRKVKL